MRRQSMQKYQGISILFFSGQSKARPRQAVIAKWQTNQWSKKGKIIARQRSKKQVQRSVRWVSRVEGLMLGEAPRYRFNICRGRNGRIMDESTQARSDNT